MNDIPLPVNYYLDDDAFDSILPPRQQQLSKVHWTPLQVVKKAASFLALAPGTKVLDIGSGVGKFCLAAAHYFPHSEFYGIEQRKDLIEIAKKVKNMSEIKNVYFKHGNFTQINFDDYEGIYFYNSFCENLIDKAPLSDLNHSYNDLTDFTDIAHIDDHFEYSASLYNYYSLYLHKALNNMSSGSRLVTFHVLELEIPYSYELVEQHFEGKLKLWIRK